jgi:hypothetical protein
MSTVHRSKSVVERNLPRWFRKAGFKAWDDFLAFYRAGGAGEDATLQAEFGELEAKGDEATPKALGKLIKFYNKTRRFSKTEVAPPWVFVEGPGRENLPADDAWSIDLANDLDHERSQRPARAPQPRAPRPAAPQGDAAPAADAEAEAPPEPAATGVVPPPASDKQWGEALRRLPGAIQLLVDGRGKNASELNERRRRALELVQLDRIHALQKHGAELRKELLTWLLEKKRSVNEIKAEIDRRMGEIDGWLEKQVAAARAKVAALDEHAREELASRLRKLYPKEPDEQTLARVAKQALDASRPKRRGNWAKKILDDFNNSRGSAAEKIRDPWILDGLIRWLSSKKDEETPTDGEIYDQIQHLGGPNMAARKKRQEGPKEPKKAEKRHPQDTGDDWVGPTPENLIAKTMLPAPKPPTT